MDLNDGEKFRFLQTNDAQYVRWVKETACVIDAQSKMTISPEFGVDHFWSIQFFDERTASVYFTTKLYDPPPFEEFVVWLGELYETQLTLHNEVD